MLSLSAQAQSIIDRMSTISGLNTVDLVESLDDVESRPMVLPMAQLILGKAVSTTPENKITTVDTSWTVVVTAKSLTGAKGHMAIIDGLLDVLTGFQPTGALRPLVPVKIEFFDRIGEVASAYTVTFSTLQRATINWSSQIIQ